MINDWCEDKPRLCENQELANALKRFWELESLGITESKEENIKEFLENVKFVRPRYEVGLPWKEGHKDLVTRYLELCMGRL